MPILSDFECRRCLSITEKLCDYEQKTLTCPKCGGKAKRIISVGRKFISDENAPWLKSVLDVVDRSNPAAHVQNFLKDPSRANYKKWMKGEGIRPLDHTEHGGPPVHRKPPEVDMRGVHKEVWESFQKRHKLEVG